MALSASTQRNYLVDVPQIDMTLPVKASAVIYEGSALMWSSGALTPVSGAGVFAGFALADAVGGASDGAVTVRVRVQGAIEMAVTTDTTSLGIVGVAATVPEMTDDNTLRIETGSAIPGTNIGKFMRVVTVAAAGTVVVGFKGAQAA